MVYFTEVKQTYCLPGLLECPLAKPNLNPMVKAGELEALKERV
jgi:hypothetical protein